MLLVGLAGRLIVEQRAVPSLPHEVQKAGGDKNRVHRHFPFAAFVLDAAFVLSWFLKATPLRQKSALQEVADQDAAILLEATNAANTLGTSVGPDTGSISVTKEPKK